MLGDVGLIGRQPQLRAVEVFVSTIVEGPSALVIEGDPGIGKTTVWRAGLAAARGAGLRVLACQGASAEVRLGYAALGDLLADVDDGWLADLPVPQRRALGAALLRSEPVEGVAPDPRAVATGLLTLLERLAEVRPLLVAVDDLQWLDRSSAGALRFAARRLRGAVGLLAARRTPPEPSPGDELRLREPGRAHVIRLEALSRDEIHRLLSEQTGATFTPPALARIDRVAAGNPFFALELARVLVREGRPDRTALPESLRELVAQRLAGLDRQVGEALLLAAALSRPRVGQLERALALRDAAELLAPAETRGIIRIDGGTLGFTHPLLASGVYAAAGAAERREAHRRLAAVADDPEERARHLALAATEADPELIEALDSAAVAARGRGAPADAAELLELARRFGADDPERLVACAECHLAAGDIERAAALAESGVNALASGPERGRALGLLGTIRCYDNSFQAAAHLLEQARAEAGPGPDRAMVGLLLAYVLVTAGRLREALRRADAAVAEAEGLGDRGLLAEALAVRTLVRLLVGEGVDDAALTRALELEDPDRPTAIKLTPSFIAGAVWTVTGRHEEGLEALEEARRRCVEQGAEAELVQATHLGMWNPCQAGYLTRARELAAEASERAAQLGTDAAQAIALSNEAFLAAWTGQGGRARDTARAAVALAEAVGDRTSALTATAAVGRYELAVGNLEAAAEALVSVADAMVALGMGDPAYPPFVPDAVEALVALGRVGDARRYVDWMERRGATLERPQVTALVARCRGLLLAATGDLEAADRALVQALDAHEDQRLPYDHARTLVIRGQVQRRRRHRRKAKESLEHAREIFVRLGAAPWVERSDAELGRLGLRHGSGDELTESERRVAELAARGLTNREVASELFISPKTVESNLSRVYRKLGIRSRAELGQRMARAAPLATHGQVRLPGRSTRTTSPSPP